MTANARAARRQMEWLPRIGLSAQDLQPCSRWLGHGKGKKLCIVGSGRTVYEDLEAWGGLGRCEVMAMNDMIMHFPRIEHAFSNDRRWLPNWCRARRPRYVMDGDPFAVHTIQIPAKEIQATVWPWAGNGTSGMGAVLTGLAMGFEQVILAGVPMDNEGHYFDPPPGHSIDFGRMTQYVGTNFANSQKIDRNGKMKHWSEMKEHVFGDRVRSLSGRTKEVLGYP